MDQFDRATELEEKHREAALAAVLTRRSTTESETVCQNKACGEPIPLARQKAAPGCRFCIECQTRREKALMRRAYAGLA